MKSNLKFINTSCNNMYKMSYIVSFVKHESYNTNVNNSVFRFEIFKLIAVKYLFSRGIYTVSFVC